MQDTGDLLKNTLGCLVATSVWHSMELRIHIVLRDVTWSSCKLNMTAWVWARHRWRLLGSWWQSNPRLSCLGWSGTHCSPTPCLRSWTTTRRNSSCQPSLWSRIVSILSWTLNTSYYLNLFSAYLDPFNFGCGVAVTDTWDMDLQQLEVEDFRFIAIMLG